MTHEEKPAEQLMDALKQEFPRLDVDIEDYIKGFLHDSSIADYETQEAVEFLIPLLTDSPSETQTERLVQAIDTFIRSVQHKKSPVTSGSKALGFEQPVVMESMAGLSSTALYTIPKRSGDISIASTAARFMTKSAVDRKKLEKAEVRLQKKQEKRDPAKEKADGFEFVDLSADKVDYHALNTSIDPTNVTGGNRSRDIKLENFDISFGGKRILQNADLTLAFGRRYGLIGLNGVGKSTLLRSISRRNITSAGKKGANAIPEWLRILHVEQEIHGDETPVLQSVLDSDAYLTNLWKKERELNDELKADLTSERKEQVSNELKDIYNKQMAYEADKAESRAAVILSGLGFSPEQQVQPTKTFSGGWRMRISLARALFCRPDVLLCDEPTNHLDINAVVWLEKYLQTWPNTLLLVSHDRDFIDSVVTDVIHMHNYRLDEYRGNYSTFLGTRSERRKNQLKEYESQLQYRQHLQAFIDRWRYDSKRASQAQSKIKILEKLPPLQPPEDDGIDDGELHFRWPDPVDKLSSPILQANEVSFKYPNSERVILDRVSFSVQLDSRVAIVGENGGGKSTTLKLLIGQLEPTKGIIQRHARLRIGFFSQHHMDAFSADQGSFEGHAVNLLSEKYPGYSEEEYRRMLGRFGLTGPTAVQPLKTLSGGQKSRVVFAMMAMNNPHILVLDEVSNHLDIMTIDSLIKALHPSRYKGGVVLVSHDARFIDRVCNELWICGSGKLVKYSSQASSLVLGEDREDMVGTSGIMDYKNTILKSIEKM